MCFAYILLGLALRILAAPFPFQVPTSRREPTPVPTSRHPTDLKVAACTFRGWRRRAFMGSAGSLERVHVASQLPSVGTVRGYSAVRRISIADP